MFVSGVLNAAAKPSERRNGAEPEQDESSNLGQRWCDVNIGVEVGRDGRIDRVALTMPVWLPASMPWAAR
jgi:hypothetical protein